MFFRRFASMPLRFPWGKAVQGHGDMASPGRSQTGARFMDDCVAMVLLIRPGCRVSFLSFFPKSVALNILRSMRLLLVLPSFLNVSWVMALSVMGSTGRALRSMRMAVMGCQEMGKMELRRWLFVSSEMRERRTSFRVSLLRSPIRWNTATVEIPTVTFGMFLGQIAEGQNLPQLSLRRSIGIMP